jgi:hypothetical protein
MNDHIKLLKKSKSSWLFPIYVPSAYRAGSAPLLNMLSDAPAAVQRKVTIVTLPSQAKGYRAAYPWARVISKNIKGIGPARMACLDDADARGHQHITVLDDDIIHVSLLERLEDPWSDKAHTRRHSAKVSGIEEPTLLVRSLAVACRMAAVLFEERPTISYGAARNALFSGDVDTSIGATLNKGSFPACVMFFDVERFTMREMPKDYQYHGEDLAMFLDALTEGQEVFTLPGVAYDQHGSIETTIPLDPLSEVGRPHLQTTEQHYPKIHPFLRVSMKNKLGGTMRIGMNWKRWYNETKTEPVEIPLTAITRRII